MGAHCIVETFVWVIGVESLIELRVLVQIIQHMETIIVIVVLLF